MSSFLHHENCANADACADGEGVRLGVATRTRGPRRPLWDPRWAALVMTTMETTLSVSP